jgi:pyrroline-5-carboxylate reductase
LFQGIITVPKRQEALTLAKRRFIKYKTVRNDVNITAGFNLRERTRYIIRGKSLLRVMENAPNERRGGVITVCRKLVNHPLLEDTKKTKVEGLKDICGMSWGSHNFDSVGGKFL